MLQRNQFLRLFYTQIQSFAANTKVQAPSEKKTEVCAQRDLTLYNRLLTKLATTVSENGAQLIIIYHSNLKISEDGRATHPGDLELISNFADLCEANNILFLDMCDYFIRYYEETHILPHGFWNTSVGSGHLNKYGHEMIAQAVYDLIKETG